MSNPIIKRTGDYNGREFETISPDSGNYDTYTRKNFQENSTLRKNVIKEVTEKNPFTYFSRKAIYRLLKKTDNGQNKHIMGVSFTYANYPINTKSSILSHVVVSSAISDGSPSHSIKNHPIFSMTKRENYLSDINRNKAIPDWQNDEINDIELKRFPISAFDILKLLGDPSGSPKNFLTFESSITPRPEGDKAENEARTKFLNFCIKVEGLQLMGSPCPPRCWEKK